MPSSCLEPNCRLCGFHVDGQQAVFISDREQSRRICLPVFELGMWAFLPAASKSYVEGARGEGAHTCEARKGATRDVPPKSDGACFLHPTQASSADISCFFFRLSPAWLGELRLGRSCMFLSDPFGRVPE